MAECSPQFCPSQQTVPRTLKDGTPTDDELEGLANEIVKWEKLGRRLGVSDPRLEEINQARDKLSEKGYHMLKHWKQENGSSATYKALCDALKHKFIQRKDLAERFCYINENTRDKVRNMSAPVRKKPTTEENTRDKVEKTRAPEKKKPTVQENTRDKVRKTSAPVRKKPTMQENTRDKVRKTSAPVRKKPTMQENTRDKVRKMSAPVRKIPTTEAEVIDEIRRFYISREGWLAPFPWCEEFHFRLDDMFTGLKVVSRTKTRGKVTADIVNMSEIFKPNEESSQPRTVLIEGKPGMGKTTYCRKLVYDWATEKPWTTGKQEEKDCFPRFKAVLLLKCRDMKSNLWEAIDDQLLPREAGEDVKEKFFNFLRENESNILLVLDGLDEVPTSKLPVFTEIIQGRRDLPKGRVVATARHEVGIKVRLYCDTLLQIEGFTEEDAREFIFKYFKTSENLAEKLLSELISDENLKNMAENPLNTALFCLDFEEYEGSFPESRTQLYLDITRCILRRYRIKKGLPETNKDLIEVYDAQLKHLGKMALNGLLEDKLDFEESELESHADELPGFGFLSVQPEGSKLRPCRRYSFQHKSFQEWFAAFFLSCQLIKKQISPDSLVADRRYAHELKEVLPYTCGFLAARCKEEAETLTKCIMTKLNKGDSDGWWTVLLECTRECKQDNSSFQVELVRELGSFLKLQTLELHDGNISAANVVVLADMLKSNTTVRELNFSSSDIGDAGAAGLAGELKSNTKLTMLKLSLNGIGDAGAASLAGALKSNSTLTELDLSSNCIGEAGAADLVDVHTSNTTLTVMDLSYNDIGDAGAAALADGLKSNTTLKVLYLYANGIGNVGAAGLADGLKSNTTLSELKLYHNSIGDAGAACLADGLKSNTTLRVLNLSRNDIGDAGAEGLADGLKSNTTPTVLNLSENSIGDAGLADLADVLKSNTTLTELQLSHNVIGNDGAADLAGALKSNTTLTVLNFSHNRIGAAGAAGLADALKCNTTLETLDVSYNDIGNAGAVALADALKSNTTLTKLNLSANNIDDTGAERLARALKSNATLRMLTLSRNDIGGAGVAGLDDARKSNTKLTLNL